MTIQTPEKLAYDGVAYEMQAMSAHYISPLEGYFQQIGYKPNSRIVSSGCWRNFVGVWEILNQKLYLNSITLTDGTGIDLATIFPDEGARAMAGWYSGFLLLKNGRPVSQSSFAQHNESYNRKLSVHIDAGFVLGISKT